MKSSNDLSADQLRLKAEELEAKEAYLLKREKSLDSPDLELAQRKDELKQLDSLISARKTLADSSKKAIASHEHHIEELKKTYRSTVDDYKTHLAEHDKKLKAVALQLKQAQSELKTVQDMTTERGQYQKQVESDIQSATEQGNRELHGINYEITNAKHVIKELKDEIRMSRQDKDVVEADISGIQQAYASEEQEVQARIANLNKIESDITGRVEYKQEELTILQRKLADTSATVDAKLIILETKEKAVIAKREALQEEEFDMNEKRRRYTSTKSLYDLE